MALQRRVADKPLAPAAFPVPTRDGNLVPRSQPGIIYWTGQNNTPTFDPIKHPGYNQITFDPAGPADRRIIVEDWTTYSQPKNTKSDPWADAFYGAGQHGFNEFETKSARGETTKKDIINYGFTFSAVSRLPITAFGKKGGAPSPFGSMDGFNVIAPYGAITEVWKAPTNKTTRTMTSKLRFR